MKEWVQQHPQATFWEIDAELDRRTARLQVRLRINSEHSRKTLSYIRGEFHKPPDRKS